ncbi:MAG: twitching motility protein PilT [Thermobacillus sp. ZCTH02-B1]|uniref:PIN/TRAM domain-containing protein n=1 Tax=Thermobacillus sp. ZCTH02-B1 TaxID=1858795 RepID=UPI000B54F94A|nr:PIN/TRAM domain-containing protein [Thermobacillus sp. ZCTH02-B1]OUM95021.1 MAG: twitching motility protein PilT [Thermobacillus sp. ZCTH02-B1]
MAVKRVIQALGLILGGMAGDSVHAWTHGTAIWSGYGDLTRSGSYYADVALGALLGLAAATMLAGPAVHWMQRGAERAASVPTIDLAAGGLGMTAGLAISALLQPAVSRLPGAGAVLPAVMTLLFGYMGMRIGLNKKEEISGFFRMLLESRRPPAQEEEEPRHHEHKILDTSVIIDGRIADICRTGFIEGTLVIPEFVLEELQHIADSSDLLKRNRGRRGLDILNKIQKELDVKVVIYEDDFDEPGEVDSKLVKLAKALRGKVVTNDFNLNKVCELQGVSVLNINDLANAVKPIVLPGEEIVVQVIKDGKEHGQGIAYLDDGTMIVVEGGRDFIGSTMEVLVTSVLQTSAGRMIFAKPKLLEKAQ